MSKSYSSIRPFRFAPTVLLSPERKFNRGRRHRSRRWPSESQEPSRGIVYLVVGALYSRTKPPEQRLRAFSEEIELRGLTPEIIRGPDPSRPAFRLIRRLSKAAELFVGSAVVSVRLGVRVLANSNPTVVVATSPPAQALIAARIVTGLRAIPLVIDYRDPWTTSDYRLQRRLRCFVTLEQKIEAWVISGCGSVLTVSEARAAEMQAATGLQPTVVPNGILEAEFESPENVSDERRALASVKFVYPGAIYGARIATLTSALRVFDSLAVEWRFLALGSEVEHPNVTNYGSTSRTETLKLVASADVGVLLNGYESDVPTKLYEYVHLGLPVVEFGAPVAQSLIPECVLVSASDLDDLGLLEERVLEAKQVARELRESAKYSRQRGASILADIVEQHL